MKEHNYFVYITTNPNRSVLYTGVTNDLERRITEHYLNRGNKTIRAGTMPTVWYIMNDTNIFMMPLTGKKKSKDGFVRKRKNSSRKKTRDGGF